MREMGARRTIMMAARQKQTTLITTLSFLTFTSMAAALLLSQSSLSTEAANLENPSQVAPNYLLFSTAAETRAQQGANDSKLEELLKDSNHSHVSDAIDLQLANSVWGKMRTNALKFVQQRAEQSRPSINRLLAQANLSSACNQSLNDIISHIAQLDQWAVQSKF